MEVVIITQARSGSTRLPNKILLKIQQRTLLQIHIDRIKKAKEVDDIIIATTLQPADDVIVELAERFNVKYFRGDENDVLDRFYQSVKDLKPKWIVRVTSDCPLIDPKIIDEVVVFTKLNDLDYCSNALVENFPDGQDVEVFKFSALELTWKKAKLKSEREHVTPFMRKNSSFNGGVLFKTKNFPCHFNFSEIRMTVDEIKDFILISKLIKDLGTDCSWLEYSNYIINNNLDSINGHIIRNEGLQKSIKND